MCFPSQCVLKIARFLFKEWERNWFWRPRGGFIFLYAFFFREEKICFSGIGNYGPINIHGCTQDAFTTSSLRSPLKHVNKGTHGVVLCSVSLVWDARSDVHAHLIHAILPIGSLELFDLSFPSFSALSLLSKRPQHVSDAGWRSDNSLRGSELFITL